MTWWRWTTGCSWRRFEPGHGRARMRPSLPLPREHGAWFILLVPYLVGAWVGSAAVDGSFARSMTALPAVLLLFISRPALMTLIKRRHIDGSFGEDAAALALGSALAAGTALVFFAALFIMGGFRGLLPLGLLGGLLFGLHLWRILARRERSFSGEIAGILMLTLTAPLACYLASASFDRECLLLWLLCALYFGSSVFYVKMKLKAAARKAASFTMAEKLSAGRHTLVYLSFMLIVLAAAAAASAIPPESLLAFAPITIYMPLSVLTLNSSANIRSEGVLQAILAVVFGLLLVFAFLN